MSKIMISSYLVYLTNGSSFREPKAKTHQPEQRGRGGLRDLWSEFAQFQATCDTIEDAAELRRLIDYWKGLAGHPSTIGMLAIEMDLHVRMHMFIPEAEEKLAALEISGASAVSKSSVSVRELKTRFKQARALVDELASGTCSLGLDPEKYKQQLMERCFEALESLPDSHQKTELETQYQASLDRPMVVMTFLKMSPSSRRRKGQLRPLKAAVAPTAETDASIEAAEVSEAAALEESADALIAEVFERAARDPSPEPRRGPIDQDVVESFSDLEPSDLIEMAIIAFENYPGDEEQCDHARQLLQLARQLIQTSRPGSLDPETEYFRERFASAQEFIEKSIACIPLDRQVARKLMEIATSLIKDLEAIPDKTLKIKETLQTAKAGLSRLEELLD
jgi:hypothetical protein